MVDRSRYITLILNLGDKILLDPSDPQHVRRSDRQYTICSGVYLQSLQFAIMASEEDIYRQCNVLPSYRTHIDFITVNIVSWRHTSQLSMVSR